MKLQLVILSALLLSALALPVPDEEAPAVQPAVVPDSSAGHGSPVEVKSEGRASEKLALKEEKKPIENAAALATKSSDLLDKKEEKLTEAIIPAASELETSKSISSPLLSETPLVEAVDEKKEEPKSLPLAPVPESIGELKAAVPEKLNPELVKPVQIVEAKSSSSIVGEVEKKTEAKLADESPASETVGIASAGQAVNAALDSAAAAAAAAEKKDDTAGRQIRGTDDKVEVVSAVVAGDVKSLSIEAPAAEPESAAPTVLAKSDEKLKLEYTPIAEVKSAAPELEKATAEKKPAEEKKPDSLSALEIAPEPKTAAAELPATLPEAKKIEESPAPALPASGAQPEEAKKQELPKKLESAKKQEIVKKESLESKESDESKESAESKEEKSA